MTCPSFERLIDYLDNQLPEAETARLGSHLATGCVACGENREWYERLLAATASDDSVAPPAWVFKRAVRIFDTELHRPKLAERVAQAIASLVFDSFAGPALAGVRSQETANRQLLYRAGDYSIDLQIAPSEHTRADLTGQVLKESEPTFESVAGLKLDIARGDKVVCSAVTDAMGEFKVSGMEQGVYNLRVELSEGSITVLDLPVSKS